MSKYKNKKVVVDGFTFDSKAEAKRYYELKILLHAGQIHNLKVHPAWDIKVGDTKICRYVADFSYYAPMRGDVTEDVKGIKTAVYRLKKKLLKICHGIDVVEIAA